MFVKQMKKKMYLYPVIKGNDMVSTKLESMLVLVNIVNLYNVCDNFIYNLLFLSVISKYIHK